MALAIEATAISLDLERRRQSLLMHMSPMIEVCVDDHRSAGAVEQIQLILQRQVVEDTETEDEVVWREVDPAEVSLDPGDAGIIWPALGPDVDGRHLPPQVGGPSRESAMPRSQVDELSRAEEPQQRFELGSTDAHGPGVYLPGAGRFQILRFRSSPWLGMRRARDEPPSVLGRGPAVFHFATKQAP